jgi:hypothetical protein
VGTRHPSKSKACAGLFKTHLACGAWRGLVEKLLSSSHWVSKFPKNFSLLGHLSLCFKKHSVIVLPY